MKSAPESPYALSKYTGERYCQIFTRIYGLETVCLRYFNVFGPRQNPNSQYSAAIPKFIKLVKEGKSPTIYGDGEQSRDFTHVSNVVNANFLACGASGSVGEIYNIACGQRITVNRLIEKLAELFGREIQTIKAEPRSGDVKHSFASIEKASRDLGYNVITYFEEGICEVFQYFIEREDIFHEVASN
jgi:UDP-glucose 4-epimerase